VRWREKKKSIARTMARKTAEIATKLRTVCVVNGKVTNMMAKKIDEAGEVDVATIS
jgi:hypothetical protein